MRHHSRPPRARTPHPPVRARLRRDERTADAQDLVVQVRHDLPRPRVTVAGELDETGAGLLTAVVDHVSRSAGRSGRRGPVDVEVDLSGVTYADSSGLAPVLDGPTRIVAASAPVRRVRRLLHDLPDTLPRSPAPVRPTTGPRPPRTPSDATARPGPAA